MIAPARIAEIERYWLQPPPERSARCAWWVRRIELLGWRPNRRVRAFGYHCAAEYFGVYIWEWLNVLSPLLERLRQEELTTS